MIPMLMRPTYYDIRIKPKIIQTTTGFHPRPFYFTFTTKDRFQSILRSPASCFLSLTIILEIDSFFCKSLAKQSQRPEVNLIVCIEIFIFKLEVYIVKRNNYFFYIKFIYLSLLRLSSSSTTLTNYPTATNRYVKSISKWKSTFIVSSNRNLPLSYHQIYHCQTGVNNHTLGKKKKNVCLFVSGAYLLTHPLAPGRARGYRNTTHTYSSHCKPRDRQNTL